MRELTTTQNLPAFVQEFQSLPKPSEYSELVTCDSPKFKPFIAKHGREATQALVSMVLTEVASLMRFAITGDMITAAAEIIIDEWPDTKMSDLHLFKRKVLSGAIGGKLFGNDTRTMCELWREYYATREEYFSDDREARYQEEKKEYAKAWDNLSGAMPEKYRQMIKDAMDKKSQKEYQKTTALMSLETICSEFGVSYEGLVDVARADCLERWNEAKTESPEVDFDWYLDFHLKSVLQHVRKSYENLLAYSK